MQLAVPAVIDVVPDPHPGHLSYSLCSDLGSLSAPPISHSVSPPHFRLSDRDAMHRCGGLICALCAPISVSIALALCQMLKWKRVEILLRFHFVWPRPYPCRVSVRYTKQGVQAQTKQKC